MGIKFNTLNCSIRHVSNLTSELMAVNSGAKKQIDGLFSTSNLFDNPQAGTSQFRGKIRLDFSDQNV